jgi:glycosyltransferase involved in cell wall biosynthesis
MLEQVVRARPKARLLFVGDFEFRATLEKMAAESSCPSRITFTGALPRETLGMVYGSMDVFVFPSLTDTQGWAIHEAAHAGLPLVLVDTELSEVMTAGHNGFYANNSAESLAKVIIELLEDPEKRAAFGKESQRLARTFTEESQVRKLVRFYEKAISSHQPQSGSRLRSFLRERE